MEGVKIRSLSGEAVRTEITTSIAPKCYDSLIVEAGDDALLMPTFKEMMYNLDLATIDISTVWRWMIVLGYQYDKNKNATIQMDTKYMVVDDRNGRFLPEYFCLEKCAHRWTQLSEGEAINVETTAEYFPKDFFYLYVNEKNEKTREYYVDTHHSLVEYISTTTSQFGGNL